MDISKNTKAPAVDKKTNRQNLVAILEKAILEYIKVPDIPKSLHKKIKKAGKMLAEDIMELKGSKKPQVKKVATKEIKKLPKKSAAKKAVKKVATK